MAVTVDQGMLRGIDLGPFLVGVVMLLAGGCSLRILVPLVGAQIRHRNRDLMGHVRMGQIMIAGSLTLMLFSVSLFWLDLGTFDWSMFGAPWVRWPVDLFISVLVLVGVVYAVMVFSERRLHPSVILAPMNEMMRDIEYRPDVDDALHNARTIAHRAEELDHELRILLAERARVLGQRGGPPTSSPKISPIAPSAPSGG
jgi:hypothetical protein